MHAVRLDRSCEAETGYEVCIYSCLRERIWVQAVEVLGPERMLFGTDWPYKPTNIEIEKLYHLGLSESELELVFYKNAEKLWERKEQHHGCNTHEN